MKATHLIISEEGDVFKTDDRDIIAFAATEGATLVVDLRTLTVTCDGDTSDIDEADPEVWRDEDEEADDESDDIEGT